MQHTFFSTTNHLQHIELTPFIEIISNNYNSKCDIKPFFKI